MFLADFHMHSTFSDGKLTIPELVDLFGAQGFGAIAITDHLCESRTLIGKAAYYLERTLTPASFPLYQEILASEAERAWKRYRMVVLPGIEFTKNTVANSRSSHILGIGVTDFTSADTETVALCRAIRSQGGLAIAAHPVHTRRREKQTFYLWDRREELAAEFDAWEVASGPRLFDEVLASGLPMIASSDLHRRDQMNSWKTLLECERHPDAILEAIRRQNLKFVLYNEALGADSLHQTAHFYTRQKLIASCA